MPSFTQTHTLLCPACQGENEVEVAFGWSPEQRGGPCTEPLPARIEDVILPVDLACEWCNHGWTIEEGRTAERTLAPRRGDD